VTHLTGRVLGSLELSPTPIDTKGFQSLLKVVETSCMDSFDLFLALYRCNPSSQAQLVKIRAALDAIESRLVNEGVSESLTAPETGLYRLSGTVERMVPSATAEITDQATRLRAEGRDIVSLSVGEPDFPPPPCVQDALKEVYTNGQTRYTEVAGTQALREAICTFLAPKGVQYSPEEVLVSNGGKQCIVQAIIAMCQPGDEVIVPAPYWVSYPEMVKLAGATPVVVHTRAQDDYLLTAEMLRNAITPRTRMILLCNPSNPTGAVYPLEALQAVARVVAEHKSLLVLSDEIYEKITFDVPHHAFAAIEGMRDRTITVNGVSKAFAMTGFRLGFIAAPHPVKAACMKVQGQLTSCASSISQACAAVAFDQVDQAFFEEANCTFRDKRDYVLKELAQIPNVTCPVPQGAFYVFPTVSAYFGHFTPEGQKVTSAKELCIHLLNCGVALVPGEAFGAPACFRISYATDMDKLTTAMTRIRDGFAALTDTR